MNQEQNKNVERNTHDLDAASVLAENLQLTPEELAGLDDEVTALETEWQADGFDATVFLTKESQTLAAIGRHVDEQAEESAGRSLRFYAQGDVRDIFIPVENTKQAVSATVRRTGDEVSSENIYSLRSEPSQDSDDMAWLRETFGNRLDVRTRSGVAQLIGGMQQYEGAVEYTVVQQRHQEHEERAVLDKEREVDMAHGEALLIERQAQEAARSVRKGLFQSAAKYAELQQDAYRNIVRR